MGLSNLHVSPPMWHHQPLWYGAISPVIYCSTCSAKFTLILFHINTDVMKQQETAGGKKGRTGKRYIQDGMFAGTSAGAPRLVLVFLISFFVCLFAFFSNLEQFDDNDSTRGLTIICVVWAASFCARLTGRRMDIGRWLHLLFPPGWLVTHFTVTAFPEKGQPASQHGPLVTVKS